MVHLENAAIHDPTMMSSVGLEVVALTALHPLREVGLAVGRVLPLAELTKGIRPGSVKQALMKLMTASTQGME